MLPSVSESEGDAVDGVRASLGWEWARWMSGRSRSNEAEGVMVAAVLSSGWRSSGWQSSCPWAVCAVSSAVAAEMSTLRRPVYGS